MPGQRVAAIALLVAACVDAASVIDDTGRTVTLDQPARRIVTLAPSTTELVLAAGAADHLVGISSTGNEPAELAGLPRVGGPGALDREVLLGLTPDLVVAWHSGNRAADLDWIADKKIPLFRSEPATLGDISRAIRAIGRLTANETTALRAAEQFDQAVRSECRKLEQIPALVVVWDRPLLSVGGDHWLNDALRAGGFSNRFATVHKGVFELAPEAAMAAADAIRLSLVRRYDNSAADRLADMLSRPGPGLADAVATLCELRTSSPGKTDPVPGVPRPIRQPTAATDD